MKTLITLLVLFLGLSYANANAQEIEVPYIDLNPPIITYSGAEGTLKIETTYAEPKPIIKAYNIADIQAKITKINGVIELWEAKKAPFQAIIDKYNEVKSINFKEK